MERILVIGMSKDRGGIENYILNLYRNIDRSKLQFDFLVKEDIGSDYKKQIQDLNGEIFVIGTFRKNVIKVWRQLCLFYKTHEYRKIYLNLSYAPTFIYIIPAIWHSAEILYIHSHASNDVRIKRHILFKKVFFNLFASRIKCVYLGCSYSACQWMFGKKISSKKKMNIINNSVDISKFSFIPDNRSVIRKKFYLESSFVVGHVGRFSIEKNHFYAIQCFKELRKIRTNAKLLLIGEGPLFEKVKEQVAQENLTEYVIFIGSVSDTSIFYNAMDCFWLPSFYEGFPIVAVEAQANGLKCIFSDRIEKTIDITKNNAFASLSNPKKWVDETLKLSSDYDRSFGKNKLIEMGYDLKTQVHTIENLLLAKREEI